MPTLNVYRSRLVNDLKRPITYQNGYFRLLSNQVKCSLCQKNSCEDSDRSDKPIGHFILSNIQMFAFSQKKRLSSSCFTSTSVWASLGLYANNTWLLLLGWEK